MKFHAGHSKKYDHAASMKADLNDSMNCQMRTSCLLTQLILNPNWSMFTTKALTGKVATSDLILTLQ